MRQLMLLAGLAWTLLFGVHVFATQLSIVEATQSKLSIDLKLSPIEIQKEGINEFPRIRGLSTYPEPGAPKLPILNRYIAIPQGKIAIIESVKAVEKTITLNRSVAFNSIRRTHCTSTTVEKDLRQFELTRNWELVSLSAPSYIGPVKTSLLKIRPVRLKGERQAVISSSVKIRILFVPEKVKLQSPVSRASVEMDYYNLLRRVFLNPPQMQDTRLRAQKVDFILASEDYRDNESLLRLIRTKEQQGRRVRIHYLNSATKEQIRDLIKMEYLEPIPPNNTIIVGSIDQMPSFRRNGYWSDFSYSLLDSGNYPDISLSRLPARNTSELGNMIDKILQRASNPPVEQEVLVTSGYETSWCHENLKYIMDEIFSKSEVPLKITKKYASEGHKTDSVVQSYNGNPNFIVYDGHGDEKGMTEIPLLMSHLSRLSNRSFPVIFDIACLNSYWPSSGASAENFAHSIVTRRGVGAAGIVSASYYSSGHEFFRHMFRASIYENNSGQYYRINEMGGIVYYGKLKYLEEFGANNTSVGDCHMFYYHGDPATRLFPRTGP